MPTVTPTARRWKSLIYFCCALVVAAGIGGTAWWWNRREPPPTDAPAFPLTPIAASPFLNTHPNVQYVGSAKCLACHQGDSMAFHRTGMGRSMAPVDVEREPPDSAYDHKRSRRRYQVARKDGQLWHRELLLDEGDHELVLQEYPVRFVVGSGRHSLTYLVETDGFLVESPITWYASRKAWGMSPGYDSPNHQGFERSVGEGCLVCHAGRAEAIDRSLHRMQVIEPRIGCERCHGPGSLHVERHASLGNQEGIDHTIVNPRHLPRALAEAVCQQCHLRANATIEGRGRGQKQFRPGLPLQDFRQDYELDTPDAAMTVVGHVEQLHLSRCYQKSATLTCTTCHNPHAEPTAAKRDTHYHAACASCHPPERCTVDPLVRAKESPQNRCVQCHMPTAPTEIPHLAFTHHRIGIHGRRAARDAALEPGVLRPVLDLARLSSIDQQRSLGLAYLETGNRERNDHLSRHYQRHAFDLLGGVHNAGLRDPALDVALARLRFDLKAGDVEPLAQAALGYPELAGQDRCNALFLLADAHAKRKDFKQALPHALELTTLRRHPADWLLLGRCREQIDGLAAAIGAYEQAVRINPRLWDVHEFLADHFRRQGDGKKAAWHQARAVK